MHRYASLLLACLTVALFSISAFALTRDGVIANAKPYRDLRWTMTSRNAVNKCFSDTWTRTPHAVGAVIDGEAYNWGGYTTPSDFRSGIAGTAYAGNRCTQLDGNPYGIRPNTVGVDCSGFVSRIWELGVKKGTSQLYPVTVPVKAGRDGMRTGDVFLKGSEHVAVLVEMTPNGPRIMEAAGGSFWRVVDRVVSWTYLSGYDYRRFPQLQDAGIAKLVLTSGPASIRHDTTFSADVTLRETDGDAVRYDEVALAVVSTTTGATVKDVQKLQNVTFSGAQQRTLRFTGSAPATAGTYRLVIRGNVGGRWTDMIALPPAVNGVPLTVTKYWWE